jgi:hypothetical protein
MAFLTENTLAKSLDLPINLPSTELKMGDWLTVATIKLVFPMKLSYRFMTLQMLSSNVTTSDIVAANKISPSLDLAFIGLYLNYSSGHPGLQPALDVTKIRETESANVDCIPVNELSGQFITVRTAPLVEFTTPGVYSFIIANNMQASSDSTIPTTTSIDFHLCATGQIRLELSR